MKRCPFCAEDIQDAAIKCRYCGSLLEQSAGSASEADKLSSLRANPLFGPSTLLGVAGSVVLFLGVFAPIVSAPLFGSQNYFQNGKGDGVVLLVLAALSLVFTLRRRFRVLWVTGLAALVLLLFTFVNFELRFSEMKAKVNSDLSDNMFKGLADAAVQSFQLQWGWAVLVVGAGLLIGAAALSPSKALSPTNTPRSKLAFTICIWLALAAIAVNYFTDGYLSFLFTTLMGDLGFL